MAPTLLGAHSQPLTRCQSGNFTLPLVDFGGLRAASSLGPQSVAQAGSAQVGQQSRSYELPISGQLELAESAVLFSQYRSGPQADSFGRHQSLTTSPALASPYGHPDCQRVSGSLLLPIVPPVASAPATPSSQFTQPFPFNAQSYQQHMPASTARDLSRSMPGFSCTKSRLDSCTQSPLCAPAMVPGNIDAHNDGSLAATLATHHALSRTLYNVADVTQALAETVTIGTPTSLASQSQQPMFTPMLSASGENPQSRAMRRTPLMSTGSLPENVDNSLMESLSAFLTEMSDVSPGDVHTGPAPMAGGDALAEQILESQLDLLLQSHPELGLDSLEKPSNLFTSGQQSQTIAQFEGLGGDDDDTDQSALRAFKRKKSTECDRLGDECDDDDELCMILDQPAVSPYVNAMELSPADSAQNGQLQGGRSLVDESSQKQRHNDLEKSRRFELRSAFDQLRRVLPAIATDKEQGAKGKAQTPKRCILKEARLSIEQLRLRQNQLMAMKTKLLVEGEELKATLRALQRQQESMSANSDPPGPTALHTDMPNALELGQ